MKNQFNCFQAYEKILRIIEIIQLFNKRCKRGIFLFKEFIAKLIFVKKMQNETLQAPLVNEEMNPYAPTVYTIPAETDIRQSQNYAVDANPLNEKKHSNHAKALVATFILWIAIPIIVVLSVRNEIQLSPGAIGGICVGIYAFYLILALACNPLMSYLSKIEHGNKFREEYHRIQQLTGHFLFSVECYHYETRHHTRTVSDGKGGTRTQHYTTTEKVVTYRNSQAIYPKSTRDDSGDVDNVQAMTLVVFIHYMISYRFADDISRQNFDYEWHKFKSYNTRDAYQDFRYAYNTPGLIERMSFYIGEKKPNWLGFLIFFSLIGLIWPYSMWIETKISRYTINFLKVLKM